MTLLISQPPAGQTVVPIRLVSSSGWEETAKALPGTARAYAAASGFEAKPGKDLICPAPDGSLALVLCGVVEPGSPRFDPFEPGRLAASLPAGHYRFEGEVPKPELAALAWLTSAYSFGRYAKRKPPAAVLVAPDGVDAGKVAAIAAAVAASRDLVNTPSNDLGTEELEAAARALTEAYGARVSSIVGDALLAEGFPMIHAVGRASPRAPRLVDLGWGDSLHPKVTLVGKGVVFDTGGLNLKPDAGMLLMKKDMGGAAAAIAAARMIMDAKLPVRLRLLLPIVENAVSGASFRPGDVLPSRKGLTVEIGNTDAEGRLILADALALADAESPALLVDFATLTGAARVALGPDLPPFYTRDDALAAEVAALSAEINDPVWRLPLWPAYDKLLESKIADVNHISSGGFAGSITAALFLNRFVEATASYLHFDIFAWNPSTKPGRPEGGEVQAARLIAALVEKRFGNGS